MTGFGPLPPLAPARRVRPEPAVMHQLPNGLRVAAVHAPWAPTVHLGIRLPVGASCSDVAALHVLGTVVARRTDEHRPAEVARLLGVRGVSVTSSADGSWLDLRASMAATDFGVVLDLLVGMLTGRPPGEADVVESVHRAALAATMSRAQPRNALRELLRAFRYGSAAPPVIPAHDAYAAVTVDDVARLHGSVVQPGGGLLVLAGAVDPQDAISRVRQALAGWQPRPALAAPAFPVVRAAGLRMHHRRGMPQSHVALAAPALAVDDPGFPALILANCAFGGYFSARLAMRLRERDGLAYRVDSGIGQDLGEQVVMLGAETSAASTDELLRSLKAEVLRVNGEQLNAVEVDAAREFMVGAATIQRASQEGLVGDVSAALAAGAEPAWWAALPVRLGDVTLTEVRAAAQRYYRPECFSGVVLGDVAERDMRLW